MTTSFLMLWIKIRNFLTKKRSKKFAKEILDEAFFSPDPDLAEIIEILLSYNGTRESAIKTIAQLSEKDLDRAEEFLQRVKKTREMLGLTKRCPENSLYMKIIFLTHAITTKDYLILGAEEQKTELVSE